MLKYKPSSAAGSVRAQGKSTSAHGPGGKVPRPADSNGKGGMGYHPAKAASSLAGQASRAPHNGSGKRCD